MAEHADYTQFKFRAINKRLLEAVVNSQLYFARPEMLNDPFDCRIDVPAAFMRAVARATGTQQLWLQSVLDDGGLFAEMERTFAGLGVCSMSSAHDETLMWSHYADEHRGVCLTYRLSEEFLLRPSTGLAGIAKVSYDADAFTAWLTKAPASGLRASDYLQELGKVYLTTKSPAWEYEHEVRIVLNKPGLLDLPAGSLLQVTFGLRTPREDIDLVRKLATEHADCMRFAQMVRDPKSDFGMTAIEL